MKFIVTIVLLGALVGLSSQRCPHDFEQAFVNRHNELRRHHKAVPLQLDNGISNWAQNWADHLASTNKFEHRPNNKYGENLYWIANAPHLHGDVPVSVWYNEISKYHWFLHEPDMRNFHEWGHFTQVVWKGSHKVGVGCGYHGNRIVVVGNYEGHGNVMGHFHENV